MYSLGNLNSVGSKSRRRNTSLQFSRTSDGNGGLFSTYFLRSWVAGNFSNSLNNSILPSKLLLSGRRKICRCENRDLTLFSSNSTTSNLQVTPNTQIGVWADCATSNRLYSSVWLWWAQNRSNSSIMKIRLLVFSTKNNMN